MKNNAMIRNKNGKFMSITQVGNDVCITDSSNEEFHITRDQMETVMIKIGENLKTFIQAIDDEFK